MNRDLYARMHEDNCEVGQVISSTILAMDRLAISETFGKQRTDDTLHIG